MVFSSSTSLVIFDKFVSSINKLHTSVELWSSLLHRCHYLPFMFTFSSYCPLWAEFRDPASTGRAHWQRIERFVTETEIPRGWCDGGGSVCVILLLLLLLCSPTQARSMNSRSMKQWQQIHGKTCWLPAHDSCRKKDTRTHTHTHTRRVIETLM